MPQKQPAPKVAISLMEIHLAFERSAIVTAHLDARKDSADSAKFQDFFAVAVPGRVFSFSWARARYGLFTDAASVKAALASGTRLRLRNANPIRYWLRAELTSSGL